MDLGAGAVHAAACSYAVAGAAQAGSAAITCAAGAPVTVFITARDAYGNLAELPSSAVQASATGPQGSVPLLPEARNPAVIAAP